MKQSTARDGNATAPKRDVHETVEEVTAALMETSRLFVAISARSLAATDPTLTLPQLRTLVVLHSHGAGKLAALAAALEVNASTALRMVDRLQAVGLVDRQTNPANRREVVLRLTPAGRRLVDDVLAHRSEEIGTIVTRLPADQRTGLVKSLRALIEAADELTSDAQRHAPVVVMP